jgi:hypothetical protein
MEHVYPPLILRNTVEPGNGILVFTGFPFISKPIPGFEEFEEYVRIPRLFELFMTGEGTLIGTHVRREKAWYKKIIDSR